MGLFGGIKKLIDWNRLGIQLDRAGSEIEKESRMYDVKVTLLKGLKAFGYSAGAVALTAVLGWASDNAAVSKALEGTLSPALIAVLVPIIHSLVTMAENWWKNRNNGATQG